MAAQGIIDSEKLEALSLKINLLVGNKEKTLEIIRSILGDEVKCAKLDTVAKLSII